MTRADDTTRLRHMLDHSREAAAMAQGRVREDLNADRQFNLALTRLMEIIGEAANRVSEETRNRHPQIAWAQIVGFRNRLIHGYDKVDFDILWLIIENDLPPLIEQLEQILGGTSQTPSA
jgi:uncharacterized protein with HEPN domain